MEWGTGSPREAPGWVLGSACRVGAPWMCWDLLGLGAGTGELRQRGVCRKARGGCVPALSYLGQGRAALRGSSPPALAAPSHGAESLSPTSGLPTAAPNAGHRLLSALPVPHDVHTATGGVPGPGCHQRHSGRVAALALGSSHASRKDTAPQGSLQGHSWKNSEGLATLSQGDTHTHQAIQAYTYPHTLHTLKHTHLCKH